MNSPKMDSSQLYAMLMIVFPEATQQQKDTVKTLLEPKDDLKPKDAPARKRKPRAVAGIFKTVSSDGVYSFGIEGCTTPELRRYLLDKGDINEAVTEEEIEKQLQKGASTNTIQLRPNGKWVRVAFLKKGNRGKSPTQGVGPDAEA